MMLTLAAVLTLSLLVRSSSQEECGCCGEAQPLISNLDIDVSISANPQLKGNGANVDRSKLNISASNRDSWCSDVPQPLTRIFNPYLTFVFNSTYLIEMVNISGDPDHSDRYVTALSIQNNTGQGFAYINDNSGIPKVFNTFLTTGDAVGNISFMDDPVLATLLQIRLYSWTEDGPCMRIELYGCLLNNSQDSLLSNNTLRNNSNTEGECYPEVLIPFGFGTAIIGAVIATAIILTVYCCRQLRKQKLLMSKTKKRSSSMDSDATLRVVNNIIYHKRRSDKRPLAPSNASTLTYDTVPVDTDHKEATTPQVRENTEGNNCELETPNKQQSVKATPIYEIQYEPVEINNGLCVILEEGERLNDAEQCKLGTIEANNGTISSHHSYEIVKDRRDAILEASSESLLDNQQEIGMNDRVLQQGGITKSDDSEGANGGATTGKKNFRGTKNIMYENITISMSPDSRHALFCESSGPQHFAV